MKVIKTIKPGQAALSCTLNGATNCLLFATGEQVFTTAKTIVDERKYRPGLQ
jgi:hypothetical protein